MAKATDVPRNYLKPWDAEQEMELIYLWQQGQSIYTVAHRMGRSTGGIKARLCLMHQIYDEDLPDYYDGRSMTLTFGSAVEDDDNEPKGSGMERNIAAMMHNDALTVGVKFQQRQEARGIQDLPKQKEYTYVTTQALAVGDLVVVYAGGAMQVAEVSRVDTVLDIEPNDNKEYEWIVQKLDIKPYEAQAVKNEQLKQLIKENYKLTARAQMRDLILNQLGGPAKTQAMELLK